MNKNLNKKWIKLKEATQNPYFQRIGSQLIKVFVYIIICIFIIKLITHTTLSNFIDSQRIDLISFLNGIQNFLEISIAIYAAVISIFATSRTAITDRLSKNDLHIGFIVTLSIGLLFNVFAIISIPIIQFRENANWAWLFITLSVTFVALGYIIAFYMTLIQLFKVSIDMSSKEVADEEDKYNKLFDLVNKIEKDLNSQK